MPSSTMSYYYYMVLFLPLLLAQAASNSTTETVAKSMSSGSGTNLILDLSTSVYDSLSSPTGLLLGHWIIYTLLDVLSTIHIARFDATLVGPCYVIAFGLHWMLYYTSWPRTQLSQSLFFSYIQAQYRPIVLTLLDTLQIYFTLIFILYWLHIWLPLWTNSTQLSLAALIYGVGCYLAQFIYNTDSYRPSLFQYDRFLLPLSYMSLCWSFAWPGPVQQVQSSSLFSELLWKSALHHAIVVGPFLWYFQK